MFRQGSSDTSPGSRCMLPPGSGCVASTATAPGPNWAAGRWWRIAVKFDKPWNTHPVTGTACSMTCFLVTDGLKKDKLDLFTHIWE